jgi:hypothetical protein
MLLEDIAPDYWFTVAENKSNWREKTVSITRTSKVEKQALKDELDQKRRDDYQQTIAFSRVWLELINFKKPVIGHNLYLDLLFSFEHFHMYNASSFGKFKETVNQCWPQLFDTKVLASEFGREDISSRLNLEELYTKLQEITQIKVKVAEGFTDYAKGGDESFHDAGYDAFVTGSCYYMLSKLEGADQVVEQFSSKVRMGTSKMFLADFADSEKDVVTTDVQVVSPENVHHSSGRVAERRGKMRQCQTAERHLGNLEGGI